MPGNLALIGCLTVGCADCEGKVLPSRVRVGDVVDCHAGVELDVVLVSPRPVFAQDSVVGLLVTFDSEGSFDTSVEGINLFVALNHDCAPIVALIERLGDWVQFVALSEALAQITKERPEEVSLVLVLFVHQLVKALLLQALSEHLFSSHRDAHVAEVVLLVEVWRVAAVDAI